MEKIIDNNKYEMYRLNISFKDSGHYTNTYILKDKKTCEAMLVDPAYNGEYISKCFDKIDAKLKCIYLTHCHGDHLSALEEIYNKYKNYGVKIYIHENDKEGIFDDDKNCKYILSEPNFCSLKKDSILSVKDDETLKLGDMILEVMHTPGHTNGSSILFEKEENILITGDTLFTDCYGRTDLKSGDSKDMKESLKKIFNSFSDETKVFPGHGDSCYLKDAKRRVSIIMAFEN